MVRKLNLGGWVKPFEFSAKEKAKLKDILKGRQNADRFIDGAQKIVKTWQNTATATSQLTKSEALKDSALKIANSADKLIKLLDNLAEDADSLLDQALWAVDKIKYPPHIDSMVVIKKTISDLTTAAKTIGTKGGNRSAPEKQGHTQAIRHLGELYENCFAEKPKPTASKTDVFHRLVIVCVPDATPHLIKKALAIEN